MVPLGLAVLAQDVPVMRPPLARLLAKVNGKRKPAGPYAAMIPKPERAALRERYSGLISTLRNFTVPVAELQRERAGLANRILRAVHGLRAVEHEGELRAFGVIS